MNCTKVQTSLHRKKYLKLRFVSMDTSQQLDVLHHPIVTWTEPAGPHAAWTSSTLLIILAKELNLLSSLWELLKSELTYYLLLNNTKQNIWFLQNPKVTIVYRAHEWAPAWGSWTAPAWGSWTAPAWGSWTAPAWGSWIAPAHGELMK